MRNLGQVCVAICFLVLVACKSTDEAGTLSSNPMLGPYDGYEKDSGGPYDTKSDIPSVQDYLESIKRVEDPSKKAKIMSIIKTNIKKSLPPDFQRLCKLSVSGDDLTFGHIAGNFKVTLPKISSLTISEHIGDYHNESKPGKHYTYRLDWNADNGIDGRETGTVKERIARLTVMIYEPSPGKQSISNVNFEIFRRRGLLFSSWKSVYYSCSEY